MEKESGQVGDNGSEMREVRLETEEDYKKELLCMMKSRESQAKRQYIHEAF